MKTSEMREKCSENKAYKITIISVTNCPRSQNMASDMASWRRLI